MLFELTNERILIFGNYCLFWTSLLGFSIVNLCYYFPLQTSLELGETLSFNLQMPFESIRLQTASDSCFSDQESLVLYDWPGTPDTCQCDYGRERFECNDERESLGCYTVEGVEGQEFNEWGGSQFCAKRYSQEELTYIGDPECQKDCGTVCLTNSTKSCPIYSLKFAATDANILQNIKDGEFEIVTDSKTIRGFLYNNSFAFVAYIGDETTTESYINNLQVSLNGDPCFLSSRQPEWAGDPLLFQNQEFGCESDGWDKHPFAEEINWETNESFFKEDKKNQLYSDLEAYSEDSVSSFENQEYFLSFLRRIPLRSDANCWDIGLAQIELIGTSLDPGVQTFLTPSAILIFSVFLFMWIWESYDERSKFRKGPILTKAIFLLVQTGFLVYQVVSVSIVIGMRNKYYYTNLALEILHENSCIENEPIQNYLDDLYKSGKQNLIERIGLLVFFLVVQLASCIFGGAITALFILKEKKRARRIKNKKPPNTLNDLQTELQEKTSTVFSPSKKDLTQMINRSNQETPTE